MEEKQKAPRETGEEYHKAGKRDKKEEGLILEQYVMLTDQHRKSVGRLLRRKPIKNLTLSSDGEAAKLRPEKSRQANRTEKGFAPMRS